MFKFNIGSAVNGVDQVIDADTVLATLRQHGFVQPELIKTAMSETETTYVVVASDRIDYNMQGHRATVYAVCEALQQDAIAYKIVDDKGAYVGYLVGPKAKEWGGAFIPEYFID